MEVDVRGWLSRVFEVSLVRTRYYQTASGTTLAVTRRRNFTWLQEFFIQENLLSIIASGH